MTDTRSVTRRRLLAGTAALAGAVPLAGVPLGADRALARSTSSDLEELVHDELEKASQAGYPGIVIGVLSGRRWYAAGTGHRAGPGSPAPDGDTVFEIGSITKTFTATLFALYAELGLLGIDDPANDRLPAAYQLPSHGEVPVTLEQLSAHISGLPRLPPGLLEDPDLDPLDPYAAFTPDKLAKAVGETELESEPGTAYAYSNYGTGMLGHALEHVSGRTYAKAVKSVTVPLGLRDTVQELDREQARRKASGHDESGASTPDWSFPTLQAAGALYGTVHDLLRYLRAQMRGARGPLGRAIEETHRHRFTIDEKRSVGLGWHVTKTTAGEMTWHNGGTGGYRSFAGSVGDQAVAVLTNRAQEVDSIGGRVLQRLTG